MAEFIYIIHIREFILLNKPIYKIGKTAQSIMKRLNQYPKGSIPYYIAPVIDCTKAENKIKKIFEKRFKLCKEIGLEYFEGDVFEMKRVIEGILEINNFCLKESKIVEEPKTLKQNDNVFYDHLHFTRSNVMTITDLYDIYQKWCDENSIHSLPRLKFKEKIVDKFGESKRHGKASKRAWSVIYK